MANAIQGRVIRNTAQIKVQPSDIDTSKAFFDSFDHMETEISASWVVRLCQELGGWHPFTAEQIQEFYTRPGRRPVGESFRFNRLVDPGPTFSAATGRSMVGGGWIVVGEDGKYRVTDDFVLRCYRSAPKA